MKDKTFSLLTIMSLVPKHFPLELFHEMASWNSIRKSPYGHSYYSEKVDWSYKPDGSYRISDHWNFYSQGALHCQTSTECPDNTHWTIAKYDSSINQYIVISSFEKSDYNHKLDINYRLLFLEKRKEFVIQREIELNNCKRILNKILSDIDLHFLNKYFEMCEIYG